MPLTFLSHQAPVVPLKMLWPRWFDGTALVVGSMAPDLLYFDYGSPVYVYAHTPWSQVWLCVPVTIVLTWVIKRVVAGPAAAHLPNVGPWHLRDYGRLAVWRMPNTLIGWVVLVSSALIGSMSHLLLDSFTHSFGWSVERLAPLRAEVVVPMPAGSRTLALYDVLQLHGSVVGAAFVVWCLLVIGRRRSLLSWYPTVPPVATATVRSWLVLVGWCGLGVATGLVAAELTGITPGAPASIIRFAGFSFLGLVVGCVACRPYMAAPPRSGDRVAVHLDDEAADLVDLRGLAEDPEVDQRPFEEGPSRQVQAAAPRQAPLFEGGDR